MQESKRPNEEYNLQGRKKERKLARILIRFLINILLTAYFIDWTKTPNRKKLVRKLTW